MSKVSVIVPIYGVAKYIEKCARSLFEQTLDDIEYIFVNDCTNDNSIEILQEIIKDYPDRKEQIQIVHHEKNKGLPFARKTGLQYATGEYVIQCDSDDWVDKHAYKKIYEEATQNDVDILFFDYWMANDSDIRPFHKKIPINNKTLLLSLMFTGYTDASPVWSALVKNNIIKKRILHPQYNQMEDKVLMFQFIYYAQKMSTLSDCLYYYRYNPLSIGRIQGHEYEIKRWEQRKANYELLFEFAKDNNINVSDAISFCKYNLRLKIPSQSGSQLYPEVRKIDLIWNKWFWNFQMLRIKRRLLNNF